VSRPEISVRFSPGLHVFIPPERRRGPTAYTADGLATLGHVVESLGVPLTEVGRLLVDGRDVSTGHIPAAGEVIEVREVERPQRVEGAPLRFLLDVHLGTLARRLRLLGVDAAYESTDVGDPALAAQSARERRVLLTRDRGLLRRRELWAGAFVYPHRPEDQLRDVLERFRPELRPWTRCMACNGLLRDAAKAEVAHLLEPGTLRTVDTFTQCAECGRVYWRGTHHGRLETMVEHAMTEFGSPPADQGRTGPHAI
jgi:uncharacterized protein with PIN domain